MGFTILLLLCGEVLLISLLERKVFSTWITPFNLLALPYTAIVLIAYFFAPALGFVSLNMDSVLIWVFGLLAFWLGGAILYLPALRPVHSIFQKNLPIRFERSSRMFVFFLSWMTVISGSFLALRLSFNMGGFKALGTDQFTTTFGLGISGHLLVLSQLFLAYLIGTIKRLRFFEILTSLALLFLILLYQGKGALLIPIVGGLIYRLLDRKLNLSLRTMILIALAGYLIFNLTYIIRFAANGVSILLIGDIYRQLFYHFWFFIFSGVLGFSELVRSHIAVTGDPLIVLAPFISIFSLLSGISVPIGSISGFNYALIDPTRFVESNVITMFGALSIFLGFWGTLAYTLLLSIGIYSLFIVAKFTRNSWLMIAFAFLGGVLVFGWFSFFFSLLTYIEIPFYCLTILLLLKLFSMKPIDRKLPGVMEEPSGVQS